MNPAAVARELVYNLNHVGCKGIVITSSDIAINTLKQAVPDVGEESCKSVPTLKHVILTGSNSSVADSFLRNAHWYNVLVNRSLENRTRVEGYFVDPESPLSVFLTSGTTGLSKAVVQTNFAVSNAVALFRFHYGSYISHYCAPLSMHHASTGLFGVFLPSTGLCKVIIPALAVNPEATLRAIQEEKCTIILTGPALMRSILSHPTRPTYDLSSLEYVTITATPIQPDFLRMVEKELGSARVDQCYGMTESGNVITSGLYASLDDNRRYTSIGRCIPNTEIKIVGHDGLTLPIGSEGEIWIRSRFIMSGYYNDVEKTAETITSSGWLRTGDLAKMDEDGYFFFVGRKKDIIIRAGVNIYPVEIERVIMEHPNVEEAHVFSIPDPLIDEVVCAFVSLKHQMTCAVDELKLFLRENLTAYKVPEHIQFVDNFVRTAMGKVSKDKLAEEMIELLKKEHDK